MPYRIMNFLAKGVGHVIFNPLSGVGQSVLSQKEGVGHKFSSHHFSNCSGPPPLVLIDQSLKILSFFYPRRSLSSMELTGMAHFHRKQLWMRPLWRCQKLGAHYLQSSIKNFSTALTHLEKVNLPGLTFIWKQ